MMLHKYRRNILFAASALILLFFIIWVNERKSSNAFIADDVGEIVFSNESGFYDSPFELSIKSTVGGQIYYTLDGSDPSNSSNIYTGPLLISDASNNENVYSMRKDVSTAFLDDMMQKYSGDNPGYITPDYPIDKCTVVRAVIDYGNGEYSKIKTGTYFVDYDDKPGYENINVICINTDPDNLFDYETGIYVTGKRFDEYVANEMAESWTKPYWWWWDSNYSLRGREYEREAVCQFYSSGKLVLSQNCGIRIHGGGTRSHNPKSLNLYARDEYSKYDKFMYDFFGTDYYPSKITLFNGGDDIFEAKDYMINELTDGLKFSTMDFAPYALFLDGEYWGCYWINEKYDENYFEHHYDVPSKNVEMIKNGVAEIGDEKCVEEYNEIIKYVSTSDCNDPEVYDRLTQNFDLDSLIDYYASLIWCSRIGDWPNNNWAVWRSSKNGTGEYNDGKWRWILFDLNSGGVHEELSTYDSIASTIETSRFFASIFNNEYIKGRILDRLAELNDTVFAKNRTDKVVEQYHYLFDEPMKNNFRRFYGDGSYERYVQGVKEIENFFPERREYIPELISMYR